MEINKKTLKNAAENDSYGPHGGSLPSAFHADRLALESGCAPILLKYIRKLDGTKKKEKKERKSGRGRMGLYKCGRKQVLKISLW